MAEERARKLGMDRRAFMASSMGLATCFAASNRVYGKVFDVDEAETSSSAAIDEKWPKGEYFIIDVQAHFTNGIALDFRNSEFVKNMGFKLKDDVEAYSFQNFVKEMFFDSETNMVVISGVPGKENQRAPDGKVLGRRGSAIGRFADPAELADGARRKKEINDLAGSQRALCQGNLAPNHYWDKATNTHGQGRAVRADGARGEDSTGSTRGSGTATPTRAASGNGFQLDDDNAHVVLRAVAQARHEDLQRPQGLLLPVAHARPPGQPEGRREGGARQSRLQLHHLPLGDQARPERAELQDSNKFDPTTGDFAWHDVLMNIKKRNPKMNNVYPRDRLLLRRAGDRRPGDVHAPHGQEHQALRRRSRRLGHRLPVVGLAAVGDRRLQALPDLRRVVREVRLQEAHQGRTRRRSSA